MGFFSGLKIGKEAGDAIASPIDAVGNTFDKLFTSDEERAQGQAVLDKIRLQPQILQAEMNKLEAQSRFFFVAGWRPFIGWVCGTAMAFHYVGNPLLKWVSALWFPEITIPTFSGTGELMNLLLALLGMAGIRSFEKTKKLTK